MQRGFKFGSKVSLKRLVLTMVQKQVLTMLPTSQIYRTNKAERVGTKLKRVARVSKLYELRMGMKKQEEK